jgi:hypothetical protein
MALEDVNKVYWIKIESINAIKSDFMNMIIIEDLNLNPPVSVLLIFASLPDCTQNQTAVSDTLRLLSDF